MTDKPLTDADVAMQAFIADCEKMSAIELEHDLSQRRLKPTWKYAAQRVLNQKRVDEEILRSRESDDLSRRNTLAAETQAAEAQSANRKSKWAIWLSVGALVITALDALANFLKC